MKYLEFLTVVLDLLMLGFTLCGIQSGTVLFATVGIICVITIAFIKKNNK